MPCIRMRNEKDLVHITVKQTDKLWLCFDKRTLYLENQYKQVVPLWELASAGPGLFEKILILCAMITVKMQQRKWKLLF